MSDELGLWILLILLLVALVLVVVTARRGPWQREETVGHYSGAPIGYVSVEETPVGLVASGVDPLWGKHPPESWS